MSRRVSMVEGFSRPLLCLVVIPAIIASCCTGCGWFGKSEPPPPFLSCELGDWAEYRIDLTFHPQDTKIASAGLPGGGTITNKRIVTARNPEVIEVTSETVFDNKPPSKVIESFQVDDMARMPIVVAGLPPGMSIKRTGMWTEDVESGGVMYSGCHKSTYQLKYPDGAATKVTVWESTSVKLGTVRAEFEVGDPSCPTRIVMEYVAGGKN